MPGAIETADRPEAVRLQTAQNEKIDYVNGLRAIAIASVVWHHYAGAPIARVANRLLIDVAGHTIDISFLGMNGWLGVNLFFVLSGFVLYLPYARGQRAIASVHDALTFLRHRAKRLLPLYYIGGFVSFAFVFRYAPAHREEWFAAWPSFLTATFIFDPNTWRPAFNVVYWSLGIEIWFSALFPLIVAALRRAPLGLILGGSIVLSVALRALAYNAMGRMPILPITPQTDNLVHRLPDFLFGMLAAHVFSKSPHPLFRSYFSGLLGLLVILGTMELYALWFYQRIPLVWAAGFQSLFDAGIVLLLLFLLTRRPLVFAPLTFWPVQLLGLMCYSIYVWHEMVLHVSRVSRMADKTDHLPFVLLATFGVSAASYAFVEFPNTPLKELFLPPSLRTRPPNFFSRRSAAVVQSSGA